MEFLITLIGNAVVSPAFRQRFLDDPQQTIADDGFHLLKGDYELMMQVFGNLTPSEREELDAAFYSLQTQLYIKTGCPTPCKWSIQERSNVSGIASKAA